VNDFAFFASAVAGASNQYLCDYYYQATGNAVAHFGGYWSNGAYAGAFNLSLNYSSANSYWFIGARIAYVPRGA